MTRMPSAPDQPMPDPTRVAEVDVARAPGPAPFEEKIGERDLASWRTRYGALLVWLFARLEGVLAKAWGWGSLNLALVVTVAVGVGVMFISDWAVGEIYEGVKSDSGLVVLDQPALDAAVALRNPSLDAAVTHFTDLGGKVGSPLLAAALTFVLFLLWRRRTPVLVMIIAVLGSLPMTIVGKQVVGRLRPPLELAVPPYEHSPSFPSGHTLNTTVVMGIAAYLLVIQLTSVWSRTLTIVAALAFSIAMGLSRVFLGHHWLTDVIAGWLLGVGWVFTVITAHRLYLTIRRAQSSS